MRAFSIILDENRVTRVVPSIWLTDDRKSVYWPPFANSTRIRQAIINCEDPDNTTWLEYSVTKFIKSKDNYNEAVEDAKLPSLDIISDPSDDEKLKRTRAFRNKRSLPDDFLSDILIKKTKFSGVAEFSSSEDETNANKDTNNSQDNSSLIFNRIPASLNILASARHNVDDSFEQYSRSTSLNGTVGDANSTLMPERQVKDSNILEGIDSIKGLVLKLLTKVNSLTYKVEKLEHKIGHGECHKTKKNYILSAADLKVINSHFPIDSVEKTMAVAEEKLQEKAFFRNVVYFIKDKGGSDFRKLIFGMLKTLMTNSVANMYSFFGQKQLKKAFKELAVCSCVYQATKLSYPDVDSDKIRETISSWLNESGLRLQRENSGTKKRNVFQPLPMPDDDEENNTEID